MEVQLPERVAWLNEVQRVGLEAVRGKIED